MAEVQEPDLGTITTLSDSEHLRALNAAGESVKIAKSNLKLLLSQIYSPGYAETLDNLLSDKMDLSTLKSQMAFIDAFGQVIGAGVNRSVLSTPLELDAFFSGFATITGTLTDAVIGDIYCVQAWDNSEFGTTARTRANQIICSSRGVWYRVWSTTWDDYIYVGGSYDSLSLTRAQAITLIDNGKLTMGVSYRITDNGNDEGIILEAISNTTFSRMGVRMSLFPKEYTPVTEGGRVWRGQWASILTNESVDIGNFYIYNSRVWQNKTGNIGTVSGYGLDSTNWDLVEVVSGDFYEVVECQCEYDIRNRRDPATSAIYTKGWVFTMTDDYGNTFGSKVYDVGDELSLVEYNMFHCPYVYNNTLKGCSNIRNRMGEVDNYIANNSGIGSVYNLVEVKITDTIINGRMFYLKDGSISNLVQQDSLCVIKGRETDIYGSSFTITKTTMANGATIIVEAQNEFIEYRELSMTSCFVYGEVKGWGTYLRTTFGTGYSCPYLQKATDSVLNGSLGGVCYEAENVYMGAGSQISFDYVSIFDTYIAEGMKYFIPGGVTEARNLFIPSSIKQEVDGIKYGDVFHQTSLPSKIVGEIERVVGSLSIPTGATFQAPTYTGAEDEVRLNGMTYASGVFTVQHEGWYKVEYIVCANLGGIAGSIDIETAIFVGSTQTNISRKVTYQNSSQWKNEYITGQVYLNVGDTVSVKYKNTGATITATTDTARLILTYNN